MKDCNVCGVQVSEPIAGPDVLVGTRRVSVNVCGDCWEQAQRRPHANRFTVLWLTAALTSVLDETLIREFLGIEQKG